MSFVVSRIGEKNSILNSVHVDDLTAELAIIPSNVSPNIWICDFKRELAYDVVQWYTSLCSRQGNTNSVQFLSTVQISTADY